MEKKTPAQYALETYKNDDPERLLGDNKVTMQNSLVRAGHGLSLPEKRLVMIGVSKLDSFKTYRMGDVPTTRITAAEYAEVAECEMNTAYEALQDAAKHLYQRSITFYEPAHKRRGKALEPTMVQMRWVGQVHYQKGEGWVELYWWPKLTPYLTNIGRQFTSYQLKQAAALRSAYSWRLLELLLRFEKKGWAEYTVEDFALSMDATPKQRENFAKIRTKIIEPAVKELNDKDGWIITWKPIKAGRKVAKVRFEFKRDPQGRLL
ncbi:replication initiation protein [Salmonella enterica]|nr:replication initiation protein [Salmonella enterica]